MKKEKMPLYLKEGERFGKLTVISVDQDFLSKKSDYIRPDTYKYLCKCDCGNIYSVSRWNLLKGKTTQCLQCYKLSVYKFLEMGSRYGRLTVIGFDGSSMLDKNGSLLFPSKWRYLCRCDCGSVVSIIRASLVYGTTQSCGCYQKDRVYETCKKYNKIEIVGNIAKVYFDDNETYAILDVEDIPLVENMWWFPHDHGYAVHRALAEEKHYSNTIRMHKLVMGAGLEDRVDHENGLRLDNRKSNLRFISQKHNTWNSTAHCDSGTGVLGVYFDKRANQFVARLYADGECKGCEGYGTIEEATEARKRMELEYFGEYAPTLCRDPDLTLDKIVEKERRRIENE